MHHEVQQKEPLNVDSSLSSLDDLAYGDSLDKKPISKSSVDRHSVYGTRPTQDLRQRHSSAHPWQSPPLRTVRSQIVQNYERD
ncbi:hypothetical protein ACOSQ2_014055 [Xanthoceras sorbifolium]